MRSTQNLTHIIQCSWKIFSHKKKKEKKELCTETYSTEFMIVSEIQVILYSVLNKLI